jgi:hypothetical protein
MASLLPPQRPRQGQSPNGTADDPKHSGGQRRGAAFMVAMLFTMIMAGALVGNVRADEVNPRVAAVAVARAEIVSGVRITREMLIRDDEAPSRGNRLPKPRERPCPDTHEQPCRMVVVDIP